MKKSKVIGDNGIRGLPDGQWAAHQARRLYQRKGYSRRWVDKRLGGVSDRHELTREWYKRGATEGEQFRALTNELMRTVFGMDVEGYKRYKKLFKSTQNLRDHMTDLELALTGLAETAAVALHQIRNSRGFDRLSTDVKDAGALVARTRSDLERQMGCQVVERENKLPSGSAASHEKAGDGSPTEPGSQNPGTMVAA